MTHAESRIVRIGHRDTSTNVRSLQLIFTESTSFIECPFSFERETPCNLRDYRHVANYFHGGYIH